MTNIRYNRYVGPNSIYNHLRSSKSNLFLNRVRNVQSKRKIYIIFF